MRNCVRRLLDLAMDTLYGQRAERALPVFAEGEQRKQLINADATRCIA
jgi:hypothetical protein